MSIYRIRYARRRLFSLSHGAARGEGGSTPARIRPPAGQALANI